MTKKRNVFKRVIDPRCERSRSGGCIQVLEEAGTIAAGRDVVFKRNGVWEVGQTQHSEKGIFMVDIRGKEFPMDGLDYKYIVGCWKKRKP